MFIAPVLGVGVLAGDGSGGSGDAEVCGGNTTGTDGVRQILQSSLVSQLSSISEFQVQ